MMDVVNRFVAPEMVEIIRAAAPGLIYIGVYICGSAAKTQSFANNVLESSAFSNESNRII